MLWRPRKVTGEGEEGASELPQPGPPRAAHATAKAGPGCRGEGTQFWVSTPVAEAPGSACGAPPSIFHMDSGERPEGEGVGEADGVGVLVAVSVLLAVLVLVGVGPMYSQVRRRMRLLPVSPI